MAKGEIILISFPFTDLTGNKLRPAVVLTENNFDVTVCFIINVEPLQLEDQLSHFHYIR